MSKHETRDGMRIEWDAPIPMDDGAVLRADVFLPSAPGRYPVILTHGPYGKGLSFQDGHFRGIWEMMTRAHPETAAHSSNLYQVWETCDPERWCADGYAIVRADSRGSGTSPGVIDLLSPREVADHAACIEWAGAQDWSNGKVGLNGISYYAINQWLVAARQPEHLAAMFAFEGAADMYRDMARHGGILTNFWRFLMDRQILSVQHGRANGFANKAHGAPVSGADLLDPAQLAANAHDLFAQQKTRELDDEEFYRARSPDWSKVVVPFCSAGSWGGHGLHLRGNTEAFTHAASAEKFLEMHGLEHWTHFYTDYGYGLQKAFFDHYLKGDAQAWKNAPRVRLQVRHPGDHFVERHESEWPLARTQWTKFYLDASSMTLTHEPPGNAAQVSYDGFGKGVTFLSAPLAEDTEITGPLAAKLSISSATEDADLFVVLRLFSPEMKEAAFIGSQDPLTPVAMGWLRASHRELDEARSTPWRPYHAHKRKSPLAPGETVALDVEIWPTSIVAPKGWRLGVSVRGRDYVSPFAQGGPSPDGRPMPNGVGAMFHNDPDDRPQRVFGGRVTLHTGGPDAAHLLAPVIPR
jgi:uncharacterized protein